MTWPFWKIFSNDTFSAIHHYCCSVILIIKIVLAGTSMYNLCRRVIAVVSTASHSPLLGPYEQASKSFQISSGGPTV